MESKESLYLRIGGEPVISKAVELFYEEILYDLSLRGFFERLSMKKQKDAQKKFITFMVGGPGDYSDSFLREKHKKKRITNEQFDKLLGHLENSFHELNVPNYLLIELRKVVEKFRDCIVSE